MLLSITTSGHLIPLWTRSAYDDVMLNCARIGYNP